MPQCGEGGSVVRVLFVIFGLQDHLSLPVLSEDPAPVAGSSRLLPPSDAEWNGRLRGIVITVTGGADKPVAVRGQHRSRSAPRRRSRMDMAIVTVTRLLRFNAAHRVHNPQLSDEENTRLFGKCNNPNWHGHNYTLEVSVKGPVDERTGYVIDLGMLRDVVERDVIDRTDHRNFNIDVDYMHGIIPTTENVVVEMWRVLAPVVAPGQLVRLRLWETENNFADYEGE